MQPPGENPEERSDDVDESSDESFPASDPPGWTTMTGAHVETHGSSAASEDVVVTHSRSKNRFEARSANKLGVLVYRQEDDGTLVLLHTMVPSGLEGHGVAGLLAKTALNFAREHGLRVVPQCPFVSAYIERHPEYKDLVSD